MADTEKTTAMLLDELAALDPPQRREVAAALRAVAEPFAGGVRRSGHCPTRCGCWPTYSIRLLDSDGLLSGPWVSDG